MKLKVVGRIVSAVNVVCLSRLWSVGDLDEIRNAGWVAFFTFRRPAAIFDLVEVCAPIYSTSSGTIGVPGGGKGDYMEAIARAQVVSRTPGHTPRCCLRSSLLPVFLLAISRGFVLFL